MLYLIYMIVSYRNEARARAMAASPAAKPIVANDVQYKQAA